MTSFFFHLSDINDLIFNRIQHFSFYNAPADLRHELRYVRFAHFNFKNEQQTSEMIIHRSIIDDTFLAFKTLFDHHYQIEKIRLIDDYQGDDDRSMLDNNSSCFNYRKIGNSQILSNHARGLAIDINPLYNPLVKGPLVQPQTDQSYENRKIDFPHKITHTDWAYKVFVEQLGWEWGGDWLQTFGYVDYQHFAKLKKIS